MYNTKNAYMILHYYIKQMYPIVICNCLYC
nr:MAG TPA: hypothetical protein [Caudoviricetes sp.]